ncbi:MAG: DDE-type integrase/transposase/recombinase [Ramlibacter sp.]|nr:DDE-type integrase/transposase/recombinase [Ramlibacter sp.]
MKGHKTVKQLFVQKGATISSGGRDYVVLALLQLDEVLAQDVESGAKVVLKIGGLEAPREVVERTLNDDVEIQGISEDQWEVARRRRELIQPLIGTYYARADAVVDKIAAKADVSRATVYRWASAYRNTGLLTSLIPLNRERGGKSRSRLDQAVEAIIADALDNFHDTEQKPSIAETTTEIRRRCSNAGLQTPGLNTIRRRLKQTEGEERTRRRMGEAEAHKRHAPHKSSIQDADWPLAMVQMDHTLLPVIIVDDIHRKAINRAWITLAIDVFSRACVGMYLSLEAPSAMSAGMCVAHAILPKEKWIRKLDLQADWPCWGVMTALHLDNAREFRGDMLRTACGEYDIDIHLRPVKKPRYGAHIERLMGTVSQRLKVVKGSTFSGKEEKGEYDAEGNACMTLAELERWLVLFFHRYHTEKHQGIGMAPLRKLEEGFLGTKKQPGRGLPARRLDEEALRINFTPFIERTVQAYGVVIDHVHYYHDILRPWINAPDPDFPRHKRNFRFHRDPRDVSQLYFFDELSRRYCAIPYRDTSLPPVSIWELKEAHRLAESKGISKENEKAIFEIINQQRALEADAAAKTKVARRKQQRRTEHAKHVVSKKSDMPNVTGSLLPSKPPPELEGYDPEEVVPLDE